MSLVLQKLTYTWFSALSWVRHSFAWKAFNPLRRWYPYSSLMQWGDVILMAAVSLLFAIAPYVATNYIGILQIGCAGVWLLLTLSENGPQPQRISPVHGILTLYWLWAGVTTLLSPVKREALNGLVELTLSLMVFMAMERVMRSPRWRTWIVTVYLFTALIVTLFGFQQWFFGAPPLATWVDQESSLANTTRIYSYLGNPNLAAAYLIPAIPFSLSAVFVWPSWGPKVLAAAMFIAHTICVVLTFSRGGWMALVAALALSGVLLLYWLLPALPPFWRTWAFPILIGGGGAVLVLAVLVVPPLRDRVFSIFVSRKDSSNNFRINVWEAVNKMIRARPLTGIGPGHDAFNKIYPLYQNPKFSALSAYSIYLEHLVEFGIFGLGAFLALLATLAQQAWVHLHRMRQQQSVQGFWIIACLAGMGGLLMHGTVDTVWYRPQVSTLWWLMAAIITSFFVPSTAYNQATPDGQP